MKPIIQRELDALLARIRALETAGVRLASQDVVLAAGIAAIVAPGRLTGRRVLTGSGTYTPTDGTARIVVMMQAGGGAGGGATGTTGFSGGGGGNSGWFLNFSLAILSGGSFSCGAGGIAVLGANGNDGNDTTLVLNGTTYTAKGGAGGVAGNNSNGGVRSAGFQSSLSTSVASIGYATYGLGGLGQWVNASGFGFALSGAGGNSPLGPGGPSTSTSGPGFNDGDSGARGGGGSGGVSNSAGPLVTALGGGGGAGLIIIDEYSGS